VSGATSAHTLDEITFLAKGNDRLVQRHSTSAEQDPA
jgi:hypothetical protein